MLDPVALADAGGWAVVVGIMIALGIGFVREWIVPGAVHRREVHRADVATQALIDALSKARTDDGGR